MSFATLIPLIMQVSIWLIVFSLGLKAKLSDLFYVLRRPWLLVRSLLAMSVIMPILAVILVKSMSLPHAVAIALVALSLAPVPPLLPGKLVKAGGDDSYAIGLLVSAALISIVLIPAIVGLLDPLARVPLSVPPMAVANLVIFTMVVPLVVGAVIHRLAPDMAARIAGVLAPAGTLMLLAAVVPVLISYREEIFAQAQDGTLIAFTVFVLVGLAAGHFLGGPDWDDRTVLALSTAARHPGVAIAIAHMNFPHEKSIAPAVLLYLLASAVLTIPYVVWRKRGAAHALKEHPT